jgi:hypothetical protein
MARADQESVMRKPPDQSPPSLPAKDTASAIAEARARFSNWDLLAQRQREELEAAPRLEQVALPCPPGFVIWRIVGTRGCIMVPALLPQAPFGVRRAYRARVIATLTGTCPICLQTAWIGSNAPDPETHPAGWATLEISIGIEHITGFRCDFTEKLRQWIDPRALG